MTDQRKTVLFAATPIDAVEFCKANGLNFDSITWVLNYQLLGEKGLTDVEEVFYTDIFKMMPAYTEAAMAWERDKGATNE